MQNSIAEDLLDILTTPRNSMRFDELIAEEEAKHSVCVDDVKITPKIIVFLDAYDGKTFTQSFRVINCGKYPAFVRILPPSSKLFKMRPLPRGCYLPSGLSITRKIFYTHSSAMAVSSACLLIYVNEKPIICKLEVFLSTAIVTLRPKILEFGKIDVGNASEQLVIKLSNAGQKMAQFSVDLGRNDLELIVQPMKGCILPSQTIDLKVELLGTQEGSFDKEFWIKMERPQRVRMTGTFIPPELIIEHPIGIFNLNLIDFPKTYYGAESIRTLVIKNSSSTSTMFCTIAEHGKELISLETARKIDDNYKNFQIEPNEGRLMAQHRSILRLTFAPKTIKRFYQNYCIILVRVLKINYRDGAVKEKDVEVKTFQSNIEIEQFSIASLQSLHDFDEIPLSTSFIRVCLYGEMERASVKFTPNCFTMNYLRPNQTYVYELRIENNSKYLPIIVKYNKVSCIEVEPKQVFLKSLGSIEVTVTVRPSTMGQVDRRIIFNLIYNNSDTYYNVGTAKLDVHYIVSQADKGVVKTKVEPNFNMGITPKITNEVGFLVDDVRFNTSIEMPIQAIVDKKHKQFNKNNDALIALPNDRPKGLRPWRNAIPCKTIFADIPRHIQGKDEYCLNEAETQLQKFNKNYYSNYIQSKSLERQSKKLTEIRALDYDLTKQKLILMEKKGCYSGKIGVPKVVQYPKFIPLTPNKLLNVNIFPKYVQMGKIAPYTTCSDFFTIENNNEFSVNISIKALSNSVVIKEKKRIVIGSKKVKNIYFDCYSHGLGKYYVPVYLIVNDCHLFDATVFAKVVPTTVKCHYKEIIISAQEHMCYFEISNPVNCPITFAWEVQDENFEIVPSQGIIHPRKNLFCNIKFIPQIDAIYNTEIYLLSQSGAKQIIKVVCLNEKVQVGFNRELITFKNVPLNVPVVEEVILRNFSDVEIVYCVSNANPMAEITVSPTQGIIHAKSDIFFIITAHFKSVVEFNCIVEFLLQDDYIYDIRIEGNVSYPSIQLEPESIQIPKIVSGACQRRTFKITNCSETKNFISFPLTDFPELQIKDSENIIVTDNFSLDPNECKELTLEFRPSEPIAYSVYLPYIVNGMIGPPVLTDRLSIEPQKYFESADDNFKKFIELPKTISVLTLRCAAGAPWLKFSSLKLYFFRFNGESARRFVITNISNVTQDVLLKLDSIRYPYSLDVNTVREYEITEDFCKSTIEPGGNFALRINFDPIEHGTYNSHVSIFVRKFSETSPFNYLRLIGSYPKPIIACEERILCIQTIYVRETISKKIILNLLTHSEECHVSTEVFHNSLSVKFLNKTRITKYNADVEVLITFDPQEEGFVDSKIIFSCKCGGQYELLVRASADNCVFVAYKSLIKHQAEVLSKEFESTFPYFPPKQNNSFYAAKMRRVLNMLESWLYSQGFFYKNFFKVPSGISRFPIIIQLKDDKNTRNVRPSQQILPLEQLLINLVDTSITKYFDPGTPVPTNDDIQETMHVYSIYKNIIKFLRGQGVFVSQMRPEYLLQYKSYVIFRDHILDGETSAKEKMFSHKYFHLFSKQCWIDLLLRIYKVFVLDRTLNPNTNTLKSKDYQKDIYHDEFMEYYENNKEEITDMYENEVKLLLWIEFHFEKQKSRLWDVKNIEVFKNPRKIRDFEKDMKECLTFATLMVSYCPYMLTYYNDLYYDNCSKEQQFQNACLVSDTWKKIHLSFSVTPVYLINPSRMTMIMLISYLYDVLPYFYPRETIHFTASLGETSANELVLSNKGNVAISYVAIFFLNDLESFKVDSETIVIPPKKEKKISVIYTAKSVLKTTAVLVLSGESYGQKFAKSTAINLEGVPKNFDFTEEFNIKADMYKNVRKKLTINSPYETAYSADTYLFLKDQENIPVSLDEFVSISSIIAKNIPREICIESECEFDEDGTGILRLNLCFVSFGSRPYFIYFHNEQIGDFCIKITINSRLSKKDVINLDVKIPTYFAVTDPCKCQSGALKSKCTKFIFVKIPCKNLQLWGGLKRVIEMYAEENELTFWNSLLDASKGFHLLRNYLEDTFEDELVPFKNVLNPEVVYKIEANKNDLKKYHVNDDIIIQDVASEETVAVPLHWNSKEPPKNLLLKIKAEHGQEIRQYYLSFIEQEP